jgi:hypothetical protein
MGSGIAGGRACLFLDGARVGSIGASYGGFMSMHLATLIDMFAASISHAGISALTGYWAKAGRGRLQGRGQPRIFPREQSRAVCRPEPEWWHHLYPESAEQQVKP